MRKPQQQPALSAAEPRKILFPIGAKLIGIVSLILVLALAGMTYLATRFFSDSVERTVNFNTMDRADLISQKLETELRGYLSIGMLIASSMDGGLVFQGSGETVSGQLLKQNPYLLGAWTVGRINTDLHAERSLYAAERLEAASIRQPENPDTVLAGHAADLEPCFTGGTVLVNMSADFGYPVLALAFPYVYKNDQEVQFILVLSFKMDQVIESLKSRELYHNFLVDAQGRLLADTDLAMVLGRPSLTGNPLVRESLTSRDANRQMRFTDEQGRESLGSYQRFLDGRLTVFSVAQANTALAEVYAIQYRNLLITVIILCAAILLLFFFSRSISRPIRRLVDSANAVRSGDFDLQLRIGNHDEIGRLAQAFTEMARGLAEREKIKDTFGKFVNKEIAELALSSDLELGGEYRQAAIFFSDIRSFTALSENLAPHAVVEFLNGYMSRMVACVDQTSGVVNKFIGDAIMAVWGVPSSAGNDTENAINCALLMRRALDEFNAGRPGSPPTRIGIGINTGEVIAGQIGSSQRMEYTCIGDAVNLASRVETLTKPFQADILISEQAHAAVAGLFRVAAMKRIKVKGKTEAQQVYAVLGRADDPNCPADMAELRRRLGLAEVALDQVDADREEEKFEIL